MKAHYSVKIEVRVPRAVANLWKNVGFDHADYEIQLLDAIRALFDVVLAETPGGKESITLLEQETKRLRETV